MTIFFSPVFTGSTLVGRQVALAAAANLTPVTLELGGKSPAIFDASCDLDRAVVSVAYAKLLNAGQTCIAPDYLMVPAGSGLIIVGKLAGAIGKLYPTLAGNPDYTAMISDRHYARLRSMVDEARERGTEIVEINPAGERLGMANRKFAPRLVLNADPDTMLMREEKRTFITSSSTACFRRPQNSRCLCPATSTALTSSTTIQKMNWGQSWRL